MMEDEVRWLYRSLLGRLPETDDTVKAFNAYYPDFDLGRIAILNSLEFRTMFARLDRSPQQTAANLQHLMRSCVGAGEPATLLDAPEMGGIGAMLERLSSASGPPLRLCLGPASLAGASGLTPSSTTIWIGGGGETGLPPSTSPLDGSSTVFFLPGDLRSVALLCRQSGFLFDEIFWLGEEDFASPETVTHLLAPTGTMIYGPMAARSQGGRLASLGFECVSNKQVFAFRRNEAGVPLLWKPSPPDAHEIWTAAARVRAATFPTLAVVSIVRNEQSCVANMIRSCLPVAAFVGILDTGSTDATVSTATAALEDQGIPFRVVTAAFTRFDEMRNLASDLVPAEIEWILMLDADEELDPREYEALQHLLTHSRARVYALPRYNHWDHGREREPSPYPDRQRRLFRNDRQNIRFTGAVHETIFVESGLFDAPINAALIGGDQGGPHIHHLVRLVRSAEEERAKQARYLELTIPRN